MDIVENGDLLLAISLFSPLLIPLIVGHSKRLIPKLIFSLKSKREQNSIPAEEDPCLRNNPQHIITLVHGTFAKNADWILYNSQFCQKIRHGMQTDVAFNKFIWSGKNSINARQIATIELRDYIKNTVSEFPSAKHTVIAHSHGGNILLDSIDDELVEQTNGFIFLSTPFISFFRKDSDPLLTTAMHWSPYFWTLLLSFYIASISSETWGSLIVLTLMGLGVLWWKFIESLKKKYDLLLQKNESRSVPFEKSLIISPVADEANGILVTTGFVTWVFKTLLGYISRFLYPSHDLLEFTDNFFEKKYGNLITLTLAVFVVYLVIFFVWSIFDTVAGEDLYTNIFVSAVTCTIISAPVLLAGPFIINLIFGVITSPIFFIIALSNLAVGREMFILSLFGEVSIDKSPPGSARILQLNKSTRKQGNLSHSEPYTSEECITQICNWLNQHDSLDRK